LIEGTGKAAKTGIGLSGQGASLLKSMVADGMTQYNAFAKKLKKQKQENIQKKQKQQRLETLNEVKVKQPIIIGNQNPVPQNPPPVVIKPLIDIPKRKDKKSKEEPEFVAEDYVPEFHLDGTYQVPPISLLNDPPPKEVEVGYEEEILLQSQVLEQKLADFGINGRVVQVLPGPVITMYEFEPAPGVKLSRIVSLADDLALALRAVSLRILAPVPGKPVVGIEIPNTKMEMVSFKDLIASDEFQNADSKISLAIGKDSIGLPRVENLATTPHLLIAGSTGSGKSVGLNAMICSILLNATPDEVKMIMVDPKMLELSIYDGIPHLIAPVVIDPKKAAGALQWAVTEMETRYKLMSEQGVRNIIGYNEYVEKLQQEYEEKLRELELEKEEAKKNPSKNVEDPEEEEEEEILPEPPAKLPYIVILIDELADLMMVASKGVEECLTRLAQMARAAGIHLIVATQRPSVDVLTGVIKANFPARISYKVISRVDSRTILDAMGADKLLGKGDMLFLPPGTSRLLRIHGPWVSDHEIKRIVDFIKKQKKAVYQEDIFKTIETEEKIRDQDEEYDEKYDEAVQLVAKERQASISYIQRRLRIGYNRAARIIEMMEKDGVVGPSDGVKSREVYVKPILFE
jgi:S-DNA-T family DNA segregation ATPase FtsK/SpoIIIE